MMLSYRRINGKHFIRGYGPLWGIFLYHRSLSLILRDLPRVIWMITSHKIKRKLAGGK